MHDSTLHKGVYRSVIHFECTKGHLRWSVSDVAKAAGMSRTLVYYYFGKTKREVLINSVAAAVEEFYGLSSERMKTQTLHESLLKTHALYRENPDYAVFFQKWRHRKSDIQEIFLRAEERFENKLHKIFPKASSLEVKAMHAIFHGLVTAPYINESSLRRAIDMVKVGPL